jgi:hypothetical protein
VIGRILNVGFDMEINSTYRNDTFRTTDMRFWDHLPGVGQETNCVEPNIQTISECELAYLHTNTGFLAHHHQNSEFLREWSEVSNITWVIATQASGFIIIQFSHLFPAISSWLVDSEVCRYSMNQ